MSEQTIDIDNLNGNELKITIAMETNLTFVEFVKPKQYNWKPQPDITAWELAMVLPVLFSHNVEVALAALPSNVTRHFSEITNEAA